MDSFAAFQAVNDADPCVQYSQKIIDLGDCGHCGSGIFRNRFLLNGNGRRDPFDPFCIRLIHPFHELACVGGEGLDVTALTFGVEGVKGQRGLP